MLPNLSFLAFTVADEAVNRSGIAVDFRGDCHADCGGQSLSERTCRHIDAGGLVHIAVRRQIGTVLVEGFRPFLRIITEVGENGIHSGTGVSFGHNDAVSVLFFGIFGVDVCFVVINDCERVHHGHGAADVSDTEVSDNLDGVVTEFKRFVFEKCEFFFLHTFLLSRNIISPARSIFNRRDKKKFKN